MLLILCITSVSLTSCYAKDIFPETLVFEGLGLPEIVNSSDTSEHYNSTIMVAGNLNDALTTMSFHRYGFYPIHNSRNSINRHSVICNRQEKITLTNPRSIMITLIVDEI